MDLVDSPAALAGRLEEARGLETIVVILVILWLAGLLSSYTMGGQRAIGAR